MHRIVNNKMHSNKLLPAMAEAESENSNNIQCLRWSLLFFSSRPTPRDHWKVFVVRISSAYLYRTNTSVVGPFHLVVEYCEHGSLKNYLRNIRTQDPIYMNGCAQFYASHSTELLNFSWQISKGMQYLSDIKVQSLAL